jgi:carboxymethylenebutenolidase
VARCAGFPDAAGFRETFRELGDKLADLEYVALVPDVYYRVGDWAPFDIATVFKDNQERARLMSVARTLTNDRVIADANAYADFLLAQPQVSGTAIGTTGYCMGGRLSLIAAGGLGRKIAAAASFHDGRLGSASPALPGAPTRLLTNVRSAVCPGLAPL